MQDKETMVHKKEKTQAAVLICAAVLMLLSVLPVDYRAVGLYPGCPFMHRLTYHFFHANALHAFMNSLCLAGLVFLTDIRPWHLPFAFAAASLFPVTAFAELLPDKPVVGASGICYVLLGILAVTATDKRRYMLWISGLFCIGFLFRETSGFWLHLYCFLCGTVLSLLASPIIKTGSGNGR